MKTTLFLIFLALTVGCAQEAQVSQQSPAIYHPDLPPKNSDSDDSVIARANLAYTNNLIPEAFSILQSAYDESKDTKYLEAAASLVDKEIGWETAKENEVKDYVHDAKVILDSFYTDKPIDKNKLNSGCATMAVIGAQYFDFVQVPALLLEGLEGYRSRKEKKEFQATKANYAYEILTSDAVQKFSTEMFLPRQDQTKNAIQIIQPIVSSAIVSSSGSEFNRLVALKKRLDLQHKTLRGIRVKYLSKDFVGPRVQLGDALITLVNYQLDPEWIKKLETLFQKDYGIWLKQSDDATRFSFTKLTRDIKNALGKSNYEDFQATLDLLSNQMEGGIGNW